MIVTAEVSLYPLSDDFEAPIISFVKRLNQNQAVEVFTHSMSTFVRGDSEKVFNAINEAFEKSVENIDTVSLIIKVVNRDLKVEKGFLGF